MRVELLHILGTRDTQACVRLVLDRQERWRQTDGYRSQTVSRGHFISASQQTKTVQTDAGRPPQNLRSTDAKTPVVVYGEQLGHLVHR